MGIFGHGASSVRILDKFLNIQFPFILQDCPMKLEGRDLLTMLKLLVTHSGVSRLITEIVRDCAVASCMHGQHSTRVV